MASWGAYVGRVGGLAVALGIGAAMATGHGVASADSSDPPGSASPESPPSSAGGPAAGDPPADGSIAGDPAAGGPSVAPPGGSLERKPFSFPSAQLWDRQGLVGGPLVGRADSHRNSDLSADPETKREKRVEGRRYIAVFSRGFPALNQTAGDPAVKPVVDEKPTMAGEPAVTPEGRSGTRDGASGISATVVRASPSPRHPVADAVERWRNQHELASVPRTGGHAVDTDTNTLASFDAGAPAEAQSPPSLTPSLSITAVDHQPVIAQATPAAPNEPNIVTRLLAPLGIGALATDAPLAPASPTSLMGILELARRELERFFVNRTPTYTYKLGTPANGAITGTLEPVDADSTSFTYTATPSTEGEVFVDSDGFVFTPNENYDGEATFVVTISDESSGFHIHGLSGLVNLVTFGLIGESGHTHTQTITVKGAVPPPDFQRTVVVEGLTQPIDFRFLPRVNENAPDRILFAEKGGAIKVYDGSQMQSTPVITLPVTATRARGVNGIEVDPDFNSNGYIYVSYIGADNIQRLSRFTVTDPKASVLTVDPTTEKVLIKGTEQAQDDHHGGEIRYIDGKLYYATGDNVCCSVVDGTRSQDRTTMYGKILRINPDGTVPTDNPYHDGPEGPNYDAIYAQGLRNPFRGGVTPDGQMVVGDVGQNTWEEINLVTAGANFGWPYAEGVCPDPGVCNEGSAGKTNPIHAYPHEGDGGSSITSVLVYDGDAFGDGYDNAVFFADFNKGWIKVVNCNDSYTSCGSARTFIPAAGNTTRLAHGPVGPDGQPDGSIYQLTIDGKLYRIAPSDEPLTV